MNHLISRCSHSLSVLVVGLGIAGSASSRSITTTTTYFFMDEEASVTLYLMWWKENRSHNDRKWSHNDDQDRPNRGNRKLTDVSMTTGVVDHFIVGDFINIGVTGPFSANGRYVHGK